MLDAVAAAMGASDSLSQSLHGSAGQRLQEPPPAGALQELQQGLDSGAVPGEEAVRLAEAVRVLALRVLEVHRPDQARAITARQATRPGKKRGAA